VTSALEEEFQIQLDWATLDAEQITVLGPLSRYVAENAKARSPENPVFKRAIDHSLSDLRLELM
jgi:hypothetical protein